MSNRSRQEPDTDVAPGAGDLPGNRRPALILFLGSLIVYAATAARDTVSADVWTTYVAANRILDVGRPRLDATGVPGWNDSPFLPVWVMTAPDGHEVIGRTPGVIAAVLPGYWISGGTTPTMLPGALTAALLTALALTLFYLAVRTRLSGTHALVGTIALGFTTPVWSVAANGLWPHTLTVLGLTGMAWAAARDRWWLVGVMASVAIWGRIHMVVVAAVVGLLIGWNRRRPDVTVKIGLVTGGSVLLLGVWDRWMYGTWDPLLPFVRSRGPVVLDAASTDMSYVVSHLGFWISPGYGVFVWSPVLLLLLPSLVRGWRDLPDWSRALAVGGLLYTVAQIMVQPTNGGVMFWGYRYGLELVAACAPALVMSSTAISRRLRRLVGPVLGLQLCMILPGALFDRVFIVPQEFVWTHNSALLVGRSPAVMPILLLLCVIACELTQAFVERRSRGLGPAQSQNEHEPHLAAQSPVDS